MWSWLRQTRVRWIVALLSLPLFGVVAAFGLAPQTQFENVEVRTVVQQLEVPELIRNPVPDSTLFWREEAVQRGDTISQILTRLRVNDREASKYLLSSREVQSLYHLVPENRIQAKTTEDGKLLSLRYALPNGNRLVIDRTEDGFHAKQIPLKSDRRIVVKSAEIDSSLFAATDEANIPDPIATQVADIFSSEIDFHRDLRGGDRFTVVYEEFQSEEGPLKSGKVLACEFINQGETYQAVYFKDVDGSEGYFTPKGQSLRKAFLRSPLEFSRISSGFTKLRFHPILKLWRSHKGVDYAAASGTKVKATADSTVAFAGTKGGYGKVIMLNHRNKYQTVYGHLSGFAKGIRVGQKVKQGDVIGYVGMTGLATGPHLHYEFLVNGIQTNPLKVAMPSGFPITGKQKIAFYRDTDPLMRRIDLMRVSKLAKFD